LTYTAPEYTPGGLCHDIEMVELSVRLSPEVSLTGTAGMYARAGTDRKIKVAMVTVRSVSLRKGIDSGLTLSDRGEDLRRVDAGAEMAGRDAVVNSRAKATCKWW
jgi:hypothetical protein